MPYPHPQQIVMQLGLNPWYGYMYISQWFLVTSDLRYVVYRVPINTPIAESPTFPCNAVVRFVTAERPESSDSDGEL